MKTVNYFDKVFRNVSEEESKNIREMLVNLSEKILKIKDQTMKINLININLIQKLI